MSSASDRTFISSVTRLGDRLSRTRGAPSDVGELARQLLLALGAVRVLVGAVALLVPALPATAWVGKDAARDPAARLLARALGGRDLALGLGAVASAGDPTALCRWAAMGAVADSCDVAATVIAYRHLPRRSRVLVLCSAGGAVLAAKLGVAVLTSAARTE